MKKQFIKIKSKISIFGYLVGTTIGNLILFYYFDYSIYDILISTIIQILLFVLLIFVYDGIKSIIMKMNSKTNNLK